MVLMNRKQKLKMVQILFMMVIGAVLETVSIGLVVPAIQMIMDPSCVEGRQRPGADLPMDRLSETGIFHDADSGADYSGLCVKKRFSVFSECGAAALCIHEPV